MGVSDAPCDTPHHGRIGGITGVSDAPCDTPMLFFWQLGEKT